MKEKSSFSWILPGGLALLFVLIFVRDTVPAWKKASQMLEARDRLYQENVSLQQEISQYRLEREQLLHSPFYNERIRRLLFQTGPQPGSK